MDDLESDVRVLRPSFVCSSGNNYKAGLVVCHAILQLLDLQLLRIIGVFTYIGDNFFRFLGSEVGFSTARLCFAENPHGRYEL